MAHVLQVREYPLILFFLVYNTLFFYQLFDPHRNPTKWTFWLVAGAYCLSAAAAFYTTKWAPFLLWPQAAIAALTLRRKTFAALTALGSLGVAALLCLPWVLSIPKNSVVFLLWDKRPPSFGLLFSRLYRGTEHLFIGSQTCQVPPAANLLLDRALAFRRRGGLFGLSLFPGTLRDPAPCVDRSWIPRLSNRLLFFPRTSLNLAQVFHFVSALCCSANSTDNITDPFSLVDSCSAKKLGNFWSSADHRLSGFAQIP